MYVVERERNLHFTVQVNLVTKNDLDHLTKQQFYFDWKKQFHHQMIKIVLNDEILGVLSYQHLKDERIEINLLAVSRENCGKQKKYERVAGNLIAYVCREAIKEYGINGCVSLIPKTALKKHYSKKYGMKTAGKIVFLDGAELISMIQNYIL